MVRIAAKATRGQRKKLPKGQSCLANPTTRKHRSKVMKSFNQGQSMSKMNKFAEAVKSKLSRETLERFDQMRQQQERQKKFLSKSENEKPNTETVTNDCGSK